MSRDCVVCGVVFEPKRPHGRYCSDRCRKRAQRRPVADVVELPQQSGREGAVTVLTRRTLEAAGREDTHLGGTALLLAAQVDARASSETGGGLAALVREYRATLAEAVRDAEGAGDELDAIRGAAALKLIAGGAG